MTEQRALFDPLSTTAAVCKACGATRQPGEPKAPGCAADRDRGEYKRRPHQCLNRVDNQHTEIPY